MAEIIGHIGRAQTLTAELSTPQTITGSLCGGAAHGIPTGGEPGQGLIKVSDADYDVKWMSILPEDTASGAVASFPDGADDLPMGVVVDIDPVQAGSGDPSPDNIRPISGRTGAKVTRTGKNLLPPQMAQGTSSIVVLGQDDTVHFGLSLKAGTYTVSVQSSKAFAFYYRAENGTENVHIGSYNVTSATFTLTEDLSIRLYAYLSAGLSVSDISNPQLELGSTAHAYEPYTAVTHEIPFSTEVYGGTLNVETGELVVDRAMVDLGTLTYASDANRPNIKFSYSLANTMMKRSPWADAICSQYQLKKVGPDSLTSGQFSTTNAYGAGNVFFKDDAFVGLTGAEVKERLAGVQFCYELAAPITLTLSAVEIRSLYGENNVFADTGDVSVTYLADVQKYIDKKISAAVAAMS